MLEGEEPEPTAERPEGAVAAPSLEEAWSKPWDEWVDAPPDDAGARPALRGARRTAAPRRRAWHCAP